MYVHVRVRVRVRVCVCVQIVYIIEIKTAIRKMDVITSAAVIVILWALVLKHGVWSFGRRHLGFCNQQ